MVDRIVVIGDPPAGVEAIVATDVEKDDYNIIVVIKL